MSDTAKNLNNIIEALGATNSEISEAAKIDRTNLSRFRNGKRTLKRGSVMAGKLIDGICVYASTGEKKELLISLTGCEPDCPDKSLKGALEVLLFGEAESGGVEGRKTGSSKKIPDQFGRRLDLALTLSGLSSAKLGRIINTDASLISKYLSGKRVPAGNSQIQILLGQTLWRYIQKNGKEKELAGRMGCSAGELSGEEFFKWLFDQDMVRSEDSLPVQKFLDKFSELSVGKKVLLPEIDSIIDGISSENDRNTYFGMKGLQEAVIRFLSESIKNDIRELWLYSEEKMDWMVSDEAFRMKWAVLMNACVRKGIRITIIHNINRSIGELTEAVGSWLPLYMSGMILPYYRPHHKKEKLVHTLFLSPGNFCIGACNVAGTEEENLYDFIIDKERLKRLEKIYGCLLEDSKPLISFDIPAVSEKERPVVRVMKNGDASPDIEIACHERFVSVTNVSFPDMPLVIHHPVLCRAFRVYCENE